MRFAAAFRIRVRVSWLRSAWVRRRATSAECRTGRAVEGILLARAGMSNLYADVLVNHLDRVDLEWNLTGHAGRFSRRDVEGSEMKRAFHDLSRQNAFLGQRRFAMGADVGGGINHAVDAIQRDMRTVGK